MVLNEITQGIVEVSQNSSIELYSQAITALVAKVVPDMIGKTYVGLRNRYEDKKNKEAINNAYINYLTTIIETVGYVKVICNKDTPIKVDDIFVETNLLKGNKIISSDNIGELLKLNPAFVQINGTGGIGKTTILKYLFVKVLSQKRFIPIFIELRKINDYDSKIDIFDFIHESIVEKNLNIELNDFKETLLTGQYVFFFDGFDEIKISYQQNIFEQIQKFRTQYINNHFFLTSREVEIMQSGWSTSTILRVKPFSKEQSIKYIGKISNTPEEVLNRFIKEINNPVFFDKYKSFITHPLLLSIMLMTYHRFASIPAKLHLFYDSAFSTLYREHDAMKDGYNREKRLELANIAQDDFEKIVEAFSIKGYIEKKNTYENRTELKIAVKKSKSIGEIIDIKDYEIDDFIWDITNVLSLLVKEGDEFRYIHRSFQEYFSAKYILRLNDDIQKQFLNKMYDKDFEKFYSDEFFSMLYDINQSQVNKNFVIPKIKEFLLKINQNEKIEMSSFIHKNNKLIIDYFFYISDYVYMIIKEIVAKDAKKIKKQQLSMANSLPDEEEKSILLILRRHYPEYQLLIANKVKKLENSPITDFGINLFNLILESYSEFDISDNDRKKKIQIFVNGLVKQGFYKELNQIFNDCAAELIVLKNIVDEFEKKQEIESDSVFDNLFEI